MIKASVFSDAIDAIRSRPFVWGLQDCLKGLAAPVLKATTGRDYFGKYAGYTTAAGALKLMKSSGFANLADLVASELTEIPVHTVVMGDIVAIPTDDEFGFSIGVANNNGTAFVIHETGLGIRSMDEVKRAFKG